MMYQQLVDATMPHSKSGKVGRPRINAEGTHARFPAGTLDRVKAVLKPGETQADFFRKSVEMELKLREWPPLGGHPDRG